LKWLPVEAGQLSLKKIKKSSLRGKVL